MGLKRILALVALAVVILILTVVCFGLLPGSAGAIALTVPILVSAVLFVVHPYEKDNRASARVIVILTAIAVVGITCAPLLFGWAAHKLYDFIGVAIAALAATAGPVFTLLQPSRKVLNEIDKLTDDLTKVETDLATAKSEKAAAEADTVAATERAETAEKSAADERVAKEAAQADLNAAQEAQADLQKQVDGLNADLSQTQKDLRESQEEAALYLSENGKLERRIAALAQSGQADGSASGMADAATSQVEIVIENGVPQVTTRGAANNAAAAPTIPETTASETPADAVIVPVATDTNTEEEDVVDGAVVLMRGPSGNMIIKESAIPQTTVYLHKVEEDEKVVSFEVCCTDAIDGPLCVGVLSTMGGKKDKEMYFLIPAGSKKSKRLIRVPRGSDVGLSVIEYLHLNPGGEVLDALNITELLPYRIQGCQSSIQAAEVVVVDAA